MDPATSTEGCGCQHANSKRGDALRLLIEAPSPSIASLSVLEAAEAIVAREDKIARTVLDGAVCGRKDAAASCILTVFMR
jgi:hypothetical protein